MHLAVYPEVHVPPHLSAPGNAPGDAPEVYPIRRLWVHLGPYPASRGYT
jgi:hypothetical protein